ncbi:MAG TPA: DUF4129 domain-containing protein [Dongiaceae bacterium]
MILLAVWGLGAPLAGLGSCRLSDCLTVPQAGAQDVDDAVKEAYDSGDLQKDLPRELRQQLDRAYSEQDLQRDLPAEERQDPIRFSPGWNPPDWVGVIVKIMFWLLIGVLVLLAVFYLGREIPVWLGRRRQVKSGATAMTQGTPVAMDSQLLDALERADRLAADGQFAEALHLLLLHSFDYLKRHLGGMYGPSNTAREILQRSRLPDPGRHSLGAIVDAAEISYFGGRPVDGGIYAACRQHYQTFAFGGAPS